MFMNDLKIALRNLLKQRYYALLNVIGLSVGIAGALLILLYVADELSYDRFHAKSDRIYRVNLDGNWAGEEVRGSCTPPPLARQLAAEVPGVQAVTRIFPPGDRVVRNGRSAFTETALLGVDPNFLEVFSFRLLAGDSLALSAPDGMVLTETAARKYFGEGTALGKILEVGDDRRAFQVRGVIKDPPPNAHFHFDMLLPIAAFPVVSQFDWSWIWLQMVTYVVLDPRADPAGINARIPDLVKTYGRSIIEHVSGTSYEAFEAAGGRWHFVLQPLQDIHLHSRQVGNRIGPVGDIKTVYALTVISLLLILIGCINFMNLSTARSVNRANEVGVKKALGASRPSLIRQFLGESLLMSGLAMIFALGWVELCLAPFNQLAGKELSLAIFQQPEVLGGLFGLTCLIGLLAGSYPAFYLTGFHPVLVLRGGATKGTGTRSAGLRKTLVIGQFAISIGLIASTLLIYRQLQFLHGKDLGFEQENVLVVYNSERLGENEAAFKQALLNHPQIQSASFSTSLPTGDSFGDFYTAEGSGKENLLLVSIKGDYDFLETLQIELVEGRNFSRDFPGDVDGVLLNQAAVNDIGWSDPVGKYLIYAGHNNQRLKVLGVIKDFNFYSLHSPIQPFAIFLFSSDTYTLPVDYLLVRLASSDLAAGLKTVGKQWKALAPDTPFEYAFLDERIDAQFRAEQRLGMVFAIFSGLAIFISCLGLLGLAAFTAEQRTREIGIRKVLGASLPEIVQLLVKDFTRLVLIANLFAWPAAYLLIRAWLNDFAYRIEIGWWTFALAGAAALSIALLTIGYQAIKAALANPVQALRHD